MLKDSDFILKAMGSYWKVLSMGTIKSGLRLGKTGLAFMQIRLKGMRQRQGDSPGGCFNAVSGILISCRDAGTQKGTSQELFRRFTQ